MLWVREVGGDEAPTVGPFAGDEEEARTLVTRNCELGGEVWVEDNASLTQALEVEDLKTYLRPCSAGDRDD
jgi:hypothetical protein